MAEGRLSAERIAYLEQRVKMRAVVRDHDIEFLCAMARRSLEMVPPPPANIGADSPSAREKALREALEEAVLQIEYLHGKFAQTGSGNAVLARARAALAAPAEGGSDG